jgi:hypothetical protein
MVTLIAVYNSEGLVGRCDARCYQGSDERCECICGGSNHGAGLARAVDNTRERAEQWIEQAKRKNEISGFDLDPLARMDPLF